MYVHDEIEHPITPAVSSQTFDFDKSTGIPTQTNTSILSCCLVKENIIQHLPLPKDKNQFANRVTFQNLVPEVVIPTKSTPRSIGYHEVHALNTMVIASGDKAKIDIWLSIAMPQPMYLCIASCSSMALEHLTIKGGVINSDYQ